MYGKSIKANVNERGVKFDHYAVVKLSNNYYGVYDEYGTEITNGSSLTKACKKAKLLEIGYMQCKSECNA